MRKIIIGNGSHIQDNAVIHADESDVEIGEYSIIGAGALVPPNHKIPANIDREIFEIES